VTIEENNIYLGDCLELLPYVKAKSVDMILCDLPYGVTKNKWDHIIDPALLWEQYDRIRKHHAPVLLFGQDKFTARMMLFRSDIHRYNMIWEKDRTTGFLNGGRMPLRNHEDIMVFYNRLLVFNPQKQEGKPNHTRGNSYKNQKNNNYGDYIQKNEKIGNTSKHPKSVLYYAKPHPPLIPHQKPVDLLRYLIRTYTHKGALVLDNCIGSGTTAIACMEEERNFIGMDKTPAHHKIATKRVENYQERKQHNN